MFADNDNPIRCSKLADIVKCSMRVFMLGFNAEDDEGPEAAQTGSLTHVGVAEFHRQVKQTLNIRKGAALEAIKNAAPTFPASRSK